MSDDSTRELWKISEKVHHLEGEAELQRAKAHKHAQAIQTALNNSATAKLMADDLEKRVRSLEAWRQWVLGASAAIGALFGFVGTFIARKLGG